MAHASIWRSWHSFQLRRSLSSLSGGLSRPNNTYFQGQYAEDNRREYFYYVDHQGMLFLTETKMKNFTSCFKDRHFLRFFFRRLRRNVSGRYLSEFPYVSHCGGERNFVKCDDTPIVFTEIVTDESDPSPLLSFNHGGRLLTAPFLPSSLFVSPSSGRVYHPASENAGGFGLVADKLAILWTMQEKRFVFDGDDGGGGGGQQEEHHHHAGPPRGFRWGGEEVELNHELEQKIRTRTDSPQGLTEQEEGGERPT